MPHFGNSLAIYLRTQALYIKAHEQDAHIMAVLARTRAGLLPAKRMMLLSGLAGFNRNVAANGR